MASKYQKKTNTCHQIHKCIKSAPSPYARNNIDETKSAESAGQSDERVHHDQHDASADGKSTTTMPKLSFKWKRDAVKGDGKSKQAMTTSTAQSRRPLSADQASKWSTLSKSQQHHGMSNSAASHHQLHQNQRQQNQILQQQTQLNAPWTVTECPSGPNSNNWEDQRTPRQHHADPKLIIRNQPRVHERQNPEEWRCMAGTSNLQTRRS